ncbi:MAG: helix-turn-helix transcriptional regulator [Clostridia bacterium]|nr:helix-turn-helix transcriptional regulator [Clostridia bacterium]
MEQLRAIIAYNISSLRLKAGLTQQELAGMLNYTDKAVSKWERGESVPDISVLARVAEIFGVTVDHLITDHRPGHEQPERQPEAAPEPPPETEQSTLAKLASLLGFKSTGRFIITLMAAAAVWLIAVIVFVVLKTFVPSYDRSWICFVFAIPATIAVVLIFNLLWGRMSGSFVLMAALVWSALGSLFVFFYESQPWVLFLIGIPAQMMIILWQFLHNRKKHK